jgi:hypothetical protein
MFKFRSKVYLLEHKVCSLEGSFTKLRNELRRRGVINPAPKTDFPGFPNQREPESLLLLRADLDLIMEFLGIEKSIISETKMVKKDDTKNKV